jgi:hypothetical protein
MNGQQTIPVFLQPMDIPGLIALSYLDTAGSTPFFVQSLPNIFRQFSMKFDGSDLPGVAAEYCTSEAIKNEGIPQKCERETR